MEHTKPFEEEPVARVKRPLNGAEAWLAEKRIGAENFYGKRITNIHGIRPGQIVRVSCGTFGKRGMFMQVLSVSRNKAKVAPLRTEITEEYASGVGRERPLVDDFDEGLEKFAGEYYTGNFEGDAYVAVAVPCYTVDPELDFVFDERWD